MGGTLPELGFEAHLDRGALYRARRRSFDGLQSRDSWPRARISTATVTGTVDANFAIRDVNAPITPDAITADGKLGPEQSTVGGLRIDSGRRRRPYAAQVGDMTALTVTGPDVKLDRLRPNRARPHDRLEPEIPRRRDQPGGAGAAGRTGRRRRQRPSLDGTLTGNAASLADRRARSTAAIWRTRTTARSI